MTRYPSETSLTVNAVGEMVRRTTADRIAAIGPTEALPPEAETGYPLRRAAATRLIVQVRAPKYRHAERGPCFELTPGAIGTLSMREAPGTAYIACPGVSGMGDLPETLESTRFISAHALRSDTSRLFVPQDGPVTAKIRDAADALGFDRDPANYYSVPAGAVLTWEELRERVTDRTGDLVIRAGGEPTERYLDVLDRLELLRTLYPRPNRGRATPAPRESLDDAGAERLVDHAVAAYTRAYPSGGPTPDPEAERDALAGVIETMRATQDPSLFRIRRAIELISEVGEVVETSMMLGVVDTPAQAEPSRETAPSEPVDATTLDDFF